MFSNRIEITLDSLLGPLDIIDDPINFDNAETNIKRSEKTHGIFLQQVNNLEFYGKSKRYLENLWRLKGPQAKCRLFRKEKHPITDEWELKAVGFLDFTTRKIKDGKLSIDFVEGGLREVLVSQMREKFELNRTTDINGKTIPSLLTRNLVLKGREIYLLSRLGSPEENFVIKSGIWNSQGNLRNAFRPAPINVQANADPLNITNPIEVIGQNGSHAPGPETNFYTIADRDRGKIIMKLNLSYRIADVYTDESANNRMRVFIRRYRDESDSQGSQFTFDSDYELVGFIDPRENIGQSYNPPATEIIFDPSKSSGFDRGIKKGDSFGLYFYTEGVYGTSFNSGQMQVFIDQYFASLEWSEDSFFKPTVSKCLTAYEAGNRLTEIYTGTPCLESYLLEGKVNTLLSNSSHNLVFAPGGWLRNLKIKQEDGSLKQWPMELSFDDFYKSIHAILPTGYGIAIKGNKQYIVLEDLKFFFQKVVKIHLGKITIKERSTAQDYCYQSLKFGYSKGGNYEKPLGLDEYNTQTTSRTPLTVTDNEYEAVGPSRTDSYGAEDARRMQYEDYPDEDTPYDKDNFMFDVKGTSQFEVRTWSDDFETPPTGVYSPGTAFNLNLSPGRNRQRHSWWFNNSIVMLEDQAIQFLNSQGNSELKTKKAGEEPLKENAESIPVPDLEKPIFEPEWIDAERDFSQSILDQITGTSLINGREVNNYYCLAEFINERNRPERAFIFTVKVKDKFTFKLLKAYGI